jgi:hypothetical protein
VFITVDQKLVYKHKPKRCSNCKNRAISTYVFGEPSDKLIEELQTNKLIKLGGCSMEVGRYQKQWHCEQCNTDFYKEFHLIEQQF